MKIQKKQYQESLLHRVRIGYLLMVDLTNRKKLIEKIEKATNKKMPRKSN